MNDSDFKKLFQVADYGAPSDLQLARWRQLLHREVLDRSKGDWIRLAVACLIGFVIGATVMRVSPAQQRNIDVDATIERVNINLQ